MLRGILIALSVGTGSLIAQAQFLSPPVVPNGVQFYTNGFSGTISGVTSDRANVGFNTSSSLILYGITANNCLQVDANHNVTGSGGSCGGTGSPGGANSQVQFNTNGGFGGISGATSDANSIAFSTNGLVINGLGITGIAGNTHTLASVTGTLVSGNCLQSDADHNLKDSGSVTCGGLTSAVTSIAAGSNVTTSGTASNVTINAIVPATTSIAAGTNITTSGTASNVTVNLVATPSFTSAILSDNLTASTGQFSSQLTGTTAVFQTITDSGVATGCVQSTAGLLSSTGVSCATQVSTPSIAAGTNITTSGTAANTTINVVATPSFTSANLSGNLTAGTAQFSGLVTGTTAVFQTITDGALSGCVQATAGVLAGTGSNCSTLTSFGIGAGTNITTSGTASNVTVNVVATPSFTSVIATGNLTGTTAQVTGFLTASGANLNTATIAGALVGSTGNFSGNLTGTTAQFSGALTGTTAVFQTITDSGVSTGCVQSASGVLSGTGSACSTVTTVGVAAPNLSLQYNNAGVLGGSANATVTSTGTLAATLFTNTPAGAGTLSFMSPSHAQFGLAGTVGSGGWFNWGGEARVAADSSFNTTGLKAVPGLSVTLQAGQSYSVDIDLYVQAIAATAGIAVALTGSYGSTDTHYIGYIVDGGVSVGIESIKGFVLSTAKNTTVANAVLSGTTGYVNLKGTITASTGGSLVVQAATFSNVAAANATTITRGSRMIVHDMP